MDEFTKYCLKRELRSFRRGWGLAVLVVGGLHFIGHMIARLRLGIVKADIEPDLYFYFTVFHLWLFVAIPLIAWWQARQFRVYRLDELRMTLIPERAVLTMVWARAAIKPLALLLILYFGLWWVFPWLYAWGSPDFKEMGTIGRDEVVIIDVWIFIINHIGLVALVSLPLIRIKCKWKHLIFILISTIFLISFGLMQPNNKEFDSVLAFTHPTVTLPYFILTSLTQSLLAVWLGLCPSERLRELTAVAAVLIPVTTEFIAIAIFYGVLDGDLSDLLDGWLFLYIMLLFYMSIAGAFWMGLKWNLICWMLRRPLGR